MHSNEHNETLTFHDRSSSEAQSESSSGFPSDLLFADSQPNSILLKVSRAIARLLLGSATALLLVAMILFAIAAWVTLWPFRRTQSRQIRLALQVMADLAALYQVRQSTRR